MTADRTADMPDLIERLDAYLPLASDDGVVLMHVARILEAIAALTAASARERDLETRITGLEAMLSDSQAEVKVLRNALDALMRRIEEQEGAWSVEYWPELDAGRAALRKEPT